LFVRVGEVLIGVLVLVVVDSHHVGDDSLLSGVLFEILIEAECVKLAKDALVRGKSTV